MTLAPPAVESFFEPDVKNIPWLKSVAENPEFLAQIESRKRLSERLETVCSKLSRPDISIEDAIKQKAVTEEQAADLYESLNELLEDRDYSRAALYLPFEFLPGASWEPDTDRLTRAADRFKMTYMDVWKTLMTRLDVRANFVDGDVLEVESRTGDLPRVVKAAHLMPKLVEKGLMTVESVFRELEQSEDETLTQSIADTLPVLADFGFIHEKELERIRASENPYVRAKADAITSTAEAPKRAEIDPETVTATAITERLSNEFRGIDEMELESGITKRREEWIRQDNKRKAVEAVANDLGAAIESGALGPEKAAAFASADTNADVRRALTEGVRSAIETAAHADVEQGKALYAQYRETFSKLWAEKGTRDAMTKALRRLHGLGVVDEQRLNDLGIDMPALAGPISKNLDAIREDLDEFRPMIASIGSNPKLALYVYRIATLFGSRLKGYGTDESDFDVSAFIKPGTSPELRAEIEAELERTFTCRQIPDPPHEFWLETEDEHLRIRDDVTSNDPSVGDRTWTYIFFDAAWEGDEKDIEEVRSKLLIPYFYEAGDHRGNRRLYLEILERDLLQYRLMHKGYERFYPSYGGMRTPHANEIDGKSTFWDSGYRQTATRLFARNVFLPKLSGEPK